MKHYRNWFLLSVLFLILVCLPLGKEVNAKENNGIIVFDGIKINEENFPDELFRSLVASPDIDKNGNGYLSKEELAAVVTLQIPSDNYSSLKGIEYFTSLLELYSECSSISAPLDLSKNTALVVLSLQMTGVSSLDLSCNTALEKLYCEGSGLASLDLSKNTALSYVDCMDNQLTTLDVTNNIELKSLNCSMNKIQELDISQCPYLVLAYENGNVIENNYDTVYSIGNYSLNVDKITKVYSESTAIRISGNNRYKTSIQIAEYLKEIQGIEKFDNIVLACGQNFPDGLSASYLAGALKAPIIVTDAKKSRYDIANNYILDNLSPDGTVYIIGGNGVIPDEAVADLSGFHCKRLAGDNRYLTNMAILDAVGVPDDSVILIATGRDFPDSLAASATGLPLFLVDGKKSALNEKQRSFLSALEKKGCSFLIIGGEGVINGSLFLDIWHYIPYYGHGTPRIAGKNRYETSVKIADFYSNASQVILSYSNNFPDALCVGPLALELKAPIILTRSGKSDAINIAKDFTGHRSIYKGIVLGGTGLISDEDFRTILGLPKGFHVLEK